MSRYEVHVRIKHVEKDRKGQITGIVMPTAESNLERAREYLREMKENIEVKIWDIQTGQWID